MNPEQITDEIPNSYGYEGHLEEVVHNGHYFFAWTDGYRMGRYSTLEGAMKTMHRAKVENP